MSFVEVPADAIRARLTAAGFKRAADADNEEVYYREHAKNPDMAVKIFTTIPLNGDVARDCGRDAIRVVALKRIAIRFGNPKTICVYKAQRVFRTGTVEGVLDRMIERARLAYQALNDDRKGPRAKRLDNEYAARDAAAQADFETFDYGSDPKG